MAVKPAAEAVKSHRVRKHARQPARQGNDDNFGYEVRGLNPANLVLRGRQPAADILQRGRHDLDVQQRHEAAEAHHDEWDDASDPVIGSALVHCAARGWARVSIVAIIESPGRIIAESGSLSSSAIRTATR